VLLNSLIASENSFLKIFLYNESRFSKGIDSFPEYMSKGLEFSHKFEKLEDINSSLVSERLLYPK